MYFGEDENYGADKTVTFENCRFGDDRISPNLGEAFKAGIDLYLNDRRLVKPGEIHTFDTGTRALIPQGHVGLIVARASATRRGLIVLTGVIDPEYTGTITVALVTTVETMLLPDDAVAQLLIVPVSDLWRDIGQVKGVQTVRGSDSPFKSPGDDDDILDEMGREGAL